MPRRESQDDFIDLNEVYDSEKNSSKKIDDSFLKDENSIKLQQLLVPRLCTFLLSLPFSTKYTKADLEKAVWRSDLTLTTYERDDRCKESQNASKIYCEKMRKLIIAKAREKLLAIGIDFDDRGVFLASNFENSEIFMKNRFRNLLPQKSLRRFSEVLKLENELRIFENSSKIDDNSELLGQFLFFALLLFSTENFCVSNKIFVNEIKISSSWRDNNSREEILNRLIAAGWVSKSKSGEAKYIITNLGYNILPSDHVFELMADIYSKKFADLQKEKFNFFLTQKARK